MKLFYKNVLILSAVNIAIVLVLTGIVFENTREDKLTNILSEKQFEISFKTQDFQNIIHSNSEQTKLLAVLPEIQGLVKFIDYDKSGSFQFDKFFWSDLLETKFKDIGKNNPNIHQIQLSDLSGDELIHIFSQDGELSIEPENNLVHRMDVDYFKKVQTLSNNETAVSGISLNIIDNVIETPHRPVLKITTPIFISGDEQLGFLTVYYNMQDTLLKISNSASGNIVIFDNDGYFIHHHDKSQLFGRELGTGVNYFTSQPELAENVKHLNEKFHYDEGEKEYRIWGKVFYDPTNSSVFWVVSYVITESELFGPIDDLRLEILYVMSPFLVGTIAISIFISRHMSKPLQELTNKITRIKKGELELTLSDKGSDEIAELGSAFNIMVKSLRQAQQTSQDYENAISTKLTDLKKFNQMLDESASISKSDLQGNFTYVNDKFCKLTKYTKDDLLGQGHSILKSGFHDNAFYHDMWTKILNGKVWTGNIRNKAKDGTFFWVKEIIIPMTNSKGETVEFLAVHIDISSQSQQILSDNK